MWQDDEADRRPWASVPISAIEHFAYCRRQAALIHLDRYFSDNVDTQRGQLAHEAVNRSGPSTSRDGTRCWHALPVSDETLGIHGVCDIVEFHNATPVPVEHKSGRYRPGSAADLQVAAQAVCLRSMFDTPVETGIIFAGKQRRRFEVPVDDALERRLTEAVNHLRTMLQHEQLPPPVADNRCAGCSLKAGCMPHRQPVATDTLFTPRPLGHWDD